MYYYFKFLVDIGIIDKYMLQLKQKYDIIEILY